MKIKLNKCYNKITNIRKDFLNKYTTIVIVHIIQVLEIVIHGGRKRNEKK